MLVRTWLRVLKTKGVMDTRGAVSYLNDYGVGITVSRFGEWERGERGIPVTVQSIMIGEVLPTLLYEAGFRHEDNDSAESAIRSIAKQLTPEK